VDPGTTSVTLTGLTNASADDFKVTANNVIGASQGSGDEYELGNTSAGTPSSGAQAYSQGMGFTVDPATDQPSLAWSSATNVTADSNGNASVSPAAADTQDALIPAPADTTFGCDTPVLKNTSNEPRGPFSFNSFYSAGCATYHWFNEMWTVKAAQYDSVTNKFAWDALFCIGGNGKTQNSNFSATLLEDTVMANSSQVNPCAL
jgi:hypothetical protein